MSGRGLTLDEEQRSILQRLREHPGIDSTSVASLIGYDMLEPEDRARVRWRLRTMEKHRLIRKRGHAWSLTEAGEAALGDEG